MNSAEYDYHELYLDSSDATTSVTANVDPLNVPLFTLPFQLNDVESFKVLQAEIPFSYCVPAGASFQVRYYPSYTLGSPSTPIIRTYALISKGVPSAQQIVDDLNSKFNADASIITSIAGWQSNYLTVEFLAGSATTSNGISTFKFKPFQESQDGGPQQCSLNFEIVIDDQRTEDLLGLRIGTTQSYLFNNAVGVFNNSLVSTRPILITGAPYIYVASNAIGNLCQSYLPSGAALLSGGVSSPQIAKIPVVAKPGHFIIWNDSNTSHWFKVDRITALTQLDLYCQLGNYGGYLDFQGLNFSVKLGVLVRKQTQTSFGVNGGFMNTPSGYIFPSRK